MVLRSLSGEFWIGRGGGRGGWRGLETGSEKEGGSTCLRGVFGADVGTGWTCLNCGRCLGALNPSATEGISTRRRFVGRGTSMN